MSVNNSINWFESEAYDHPELRSPQPCPRGAFCQYKVINPKTGQLELACCRMVHPGEEGTGERRIIPGPTSNPLQRGATVRLTGGASFYERRYKKVPWRVWATEKGIPLPPIEQPWESVKRVAYLPKPFPPKRRTTTVREDAVREDTVPVCAKPEGQQWPAMLTPASTRAQNPTTEAIHAILDNVKVDVPLGIARCGGAQVNTTVPFKKDSILNGLKYEELRCEVLQDVQEYEKQCNCIKGQCAPYTMIDGRILCILCVTKSCPTCVPRMEEYLRFRPF